MKKLKPSELAPLKVLILLSLQVITWANESFFALGVWFSTLEDMSLNSNFIEKLRK